MREEEIFVVLGCVFFLAASLLWSYTQTLPDEVRQAIERNRKLLEEVESIQGELQTCTSQLEKWRPTVH
jgi:hypothetical protein